MDNIEIRLVRTSITIVAFILLLLFEIINYKKINTKRRKHLKKERRIILVALLVNISAILFIGFYFVNASLDLALKDYEAKVTDVFKIADTAMASKAQLGWTIYFDDNFYCYSYRYSDRMLLQNSEEGIVYKVTYAKRSHLIISIEEISDTDVNSEKNSRLP